MVNDELKKIYSALITPMNTNESVNYNALRKVVNMQLNDGVEGFYCCGSSGEGLLLSLNERMKIVDTVLEEVNGKVPVIAHVGTIRTKDAIELATHAKDSGANAISMIPPYYYHFTMGEIIGYYQEILNNVSEVKGIIYNIPQFTGVEFSKNNARELFENPNIIGIKHTSTNMYNLERINDSYPDKIIMNGFDEQFLGALSLGAISTVGTTVNLFYPYFAKIKNLYNDNKMEEAREEQRKINNAIEILVKEGIFNSVKYGWTVRGIDCGSCRSPFKPLTNESKDIVKKLIEEMVTY